MYMSSAAVQDWNTTCGCQLPLRTFLMFPAQHTCLCTLKGGFLGIYLGKDSKQQATSVTTASCSAPLSCQHLSRQSMLLKPNGNAGLGLLPFVKAG